MAGYSFNDRRIKYFKNRRRKRRLAIVLAAYCIGACNSNCSYDQMFAMAATSCPALSSALDGISGQNILKGLALSESSLNTDAMSQAGYDGSHSWGIMQINTTSHPDYSSWRLRSDANLNIKIGTADLCSKLLHYGNLKDAIAHYKGWWGYNSGPMAKEQTDTAIDLMERIQKQ